jgi:hypothetical protein
LAIFDNTVDGTARFVLVVVMTRLATLLFPGTIYALFLQKKYIYILLLFFHFLYHIIYFLLHAKKKKKIIT